MGFYGTGDQRVVVTEPSADKKIYSSTGLADLTRKANGTYQVTRHYNFVGELASSRAVTTEVPQRTRKHLGRLGAF